MTIIFIPRRPSRTNHVDEDDEKDIKKDDDEPSNRTNTKKAKRV